MRLPTQLRLAVEIGLGGGQALARQLGLPGHARQIGLEGSEIALHAHQPGLGLLGGEAIGLGVDGEELIARFEQLALAHGDAHDLAGNLGRDQHLLGADVGVVGGDVAATENIECQGRPMATRAGTSTSSVVRNDGSLVSSAPRPAVAAGPFVNQPLCRLKATKHGVCSSRPRQPSMATHALAGGSASMTAPLDVTSDRSRPWTCECCS